MEYPPVLLAKLADRKYRYEQLGDKSALFDALVHCVTWQLPAPEWVRYALMSASMAKARREITDWSEVFGDLLPKKTQRLQKLSSAKLEVLGGDIMMAVAVSQKAGVPPDWNAIAKQVTDAHKERTGEALKLSGKRANDIYYRTRESLGTLLAGGAEISPLAKLFGEEAALILAGEPKRGRPKRR